MEWTRKSRNYRFVLAGLASWILLAPGWGVASGFQNTMEHRSRVNRWASQLYYSESSTAPQPYDAVGTVKRQARTRESCALRLRRQAWRERVDGIIAVKYSAELLANQITCQGETIRWKAAETQPETAPNPSSETQPTYRNP